MGHQCVATHGVIHQVSLSSHKNVSIRLTNQDHQAGSLMGLLLVAGHLLVSLVFGVSRIGALSGGSLPVLTAQTEAPP